MFKLFLCAALLALGTFRECNTASLPSQEDQGQRNIAQISTIGDYLNEKSEITVKPGQQRFFLDLLPYLRDFMLPKLITKRAVEASVSAGQDQQGGQKLTTPAAASSAGQTGAVASNPIRNGMDRLQEGVDTMVATKISAINDMNKSFLTTLLTFPQTFLRLILAGLRFPVDALG